MSYLPGCFIIELHVYVCVSNMLDAPSCRQLMGSWILCRLQWIISPKNQSVHTLHKIWQDNTEYQLFVGCDWWWYFKLKMTDIQWCVLKRFLFIVRKKSCKYIILCICRMSISLLYEVKSCYWSYVSKLNISSTCSMILQTWDQDIIK